MSGERPCAILPPQQIGSTTGSVGALFRVPHNEGSRNPASRWSRGVFRPADECISIRLGPRG
jgi:hypothetical protein